MWAGWMICILILLVRDELKKGEGRGKKAAQNKTIISEFKGLEIGIN